MKKSELRKSFSFPKETEIETRKRKRLLDKITKDVSRLGATGIILVGSLSWGKDHAVSKTSDIDLYIIGTLYGIGNVIKKSPYLANDRKIMYLLFSKFVNYYDKLNIALFSLKSKLNAFNASIYFLPESQFKEICSFGAQIKSEGLQETIFRNLRPNYSPQRKILRSFDGSTIKYSTKFDLQTKKLYPFHLRRDLFALVSNRKLYGSIFLSHLLSGEILFDQEGIVQQGMEKIWKLVAKEFIKSNHINQKIFFQGRDINYGIINFINRVYEMSFEAKAKFNIKFKDKLNRLIRSNF